MFDQGFAMKTQDGMPDPEERGWMPGHCAPMDVPLEARIRDEHGPYRLKSKVVRKVNPEDGKVGWWNEDRQTWLQVQVHQWRFHPSYTPPRRKPVRSPKE